MEVMLELSLMKGRQGDRIRRAAQVSGWGAGAAGRFESGEGSGSLSLYSVPCAPESGYVTAVSQGITLPEAAIMSEKVLLEGHDEPGFCPDGTTLIAGELLSRPGETESQLFDRILSGWNWWVDLRATSRELAVAWGAPNKDLLFLFNRLDAGFLDEFPQRALAAGKVERLVGFHPSSILFGKSAEVPVMPPPDVDDVHLMTTWTLGTESFWSALLHNNQKVGR
jgi:hypothetical protein